MQPEQPTKPVAKREPKRSVAPNVQVVEYYTAGGWNAYPAPKNSINDLIATNGARHHFIQIVGSDDVRTEQLPQNTFIQNAFSNGALPIYAKVGPKVSLEDVNTRTRVLIKRKKAETPSVKTDK